jgi:hypothetical protein
MGADYVFERNEQKGIGAVARCGDDPSIFVVHLETMGDVERWLAADFVED